MFIIVLKIREVKENEEVIEPLLKCQEDFLLDGVRELEQNNIYIDLNGKQKNSFLLLIYLKKLQNIDIKSIQGNIELCRNKNK